MNKIKTAFLFSGQGAQAPGMAKELYDNFESVKDVFRTAKKVLGRDIAALCFEGAQEELDLTHNTQVCLLAADVASGRALNASGVYADCAAGFSLGEYAALVYAGALNIEDAFRLVQIRADAMQEAVPVGEGAMAVLMGADGESAGAICAKVTAGYVVPANFNSPVQTVISGSAAGVNEAVRIAEGEGLMTVRLAVSVPSHCELMGPAARRIKSEMESITFNRPNVPVYCNLTGDIIGADGDIAQLLVRQVMSPVQWIKTLQNMYAAGVQNYIECGTGKTLWGLTRRTLKGVAAMRAVDLNTLKKVLEA